MGKFQDLTGQTFGALTVLRRIDNYISSGGNSFSQYECVCECGRHKNVVGSKLKTGHVKSCGQCNAFSNFKDLTGMKFDKLYVESIDGYYEYPDGSRDYRWRCRCDCGNYITVRGNSLKKGSNHSCKRCSTKKYNRIVASDMIGKKFGRLTVISQAESRYTNQNTVVDWWNCKCECGSLLKVRGASLRNGHTMSCGCYRLEMLSGPEYASKFERAVRKFLDDNCCQYTVQQTFPELIGIGGNLLSYDFCVCKSDRKYLIELNGAQHYQSVDFFGGDRVFVRQKVHDFRKKQYAESHGYLLLVVNCTNVNCDTACKQVAEFLGL